MLTRFKVFPLGGIFCAQRNKKNYYCFSSEFRQKRTMKSRIKFNFSAAENSTNQSYCSLCVPRDHNNSRSVWMIPSSGKPPGLCWAEKNFKTRKELAKSLANRDYGAMLIAKQKNQNTLFALH